MNLKWQNKWIILIRCNLIFISFRFVPGYFIEPHFCIPGAWQMIPAGAIYLRACEEFVILNQRSPIVVFESRRKKLRLINTYWAKLHSCKGAVHKPREPSRPGKRNVLKIGVHTFLWILDHVDRMGIIISRPRGLWKVPWEILFSFVSLCNKIMSN